MMSKIRDLKGFVNRKKLKPSKMMVFGTRFPLHFEIHQKKPFTYLQYEVLKTINDYNI